MKRAFRILIGILILTSVLTGVAVSDDVKICSECNREISGKWIVTDNGNYYHPDHFTCAQCGKPIESAYSIFQGKNYHNECYRDHVALRCSICNGIIDGNYKYDFWGHKYHPEHEDELPRCWSCGQLISARTTGGGVKYADGRTICEHCSAEAVTDIHKAEQLMKEVAEEMSSFGIEIDPDNLNLHLVNLQEMNKRAGRLRKDARGFTDYREISRAFGLIRSKGANVYVLVGLPRDEMISVVAHELAHVWQNTHGQLKGNLSWSEGSCNYAAYLVMQKHNTELMEYLMQVMEEDSDPHYGEGFRRVKEYVNDSGITSWLEQLTMNDNFPEGY